MRIRRVAAASACVLTAAVSTSVAQSPPPGAVTARARTRPASRRSFESSSVPNRCPPPGRCRGRSSWPAPAASGSTAEPARRPAPAQPPRASPARRPAASAVAARSSWSAAPCFRPTDWPTPRRSTSSSPPAQVGGDLFGVEVQLREESFGIRQRAVGRLVPHPLRPVRLRAALRVRRGVRGALGLQRRAEAARAERGREADRDEDQDHQAQRKAEARNTPGSPPPDPQPADLPGQLAVRAQARPGGRRGSPSRRGALHALTLRRPGPPAPS